jgi:exonuclease V gamma subunit
VCLTDRGPARINPLLETLQTLLELGDGRVTASEVVDLAARPPVAQTVAVARTVRLRNSSGPSRVTQRR